MMISGAGFGPSMETTPSEKKARYVNNNQNPIEIILTSDKNKNILGFFPHLVTPTAKDFAKPNISTKHPFRRKTQSVAHLPAWPQG